MGKVLSKTQFNPLSKSILTGMACGTANFGLDAVQELRRMAIITKTIKDKNDALNKGKVVSIPRENFLLNSGIIPHV